MHRHVPLSDVGLGAGRRHRRDPATPRGAPPHRVPPGRHAALPGDARPTRSSRSSPRPTACEGARRSDAAWVMEACGLADALGKRIKECSTGFRKRIGLAASARPRSVQVIILDEPTHGLDPLQVVAFRDLVRSLRPNRTILLSSHIISEVAQLADRLLLIHEGAARGRIGSSATSRAPKGYPRRTSRALFLHLVKKGAVRGRTRSRRLPLKRRHRRQRSRGLLAGSARHARARDRRVLQLVDRLRLRVRVPAPRARHLHERVLPRVGRSTSGVLPRLPFLLALFIPAITMRAGRRSARAARSSS